MKLTRRDIVANLKGVFVPAATPFDRRGEVDLSRFQQNLRHYAESGLAGVIVAGSTGEAPYLTERERLRLVSAARRIIRPPQIIIVGTGLESTRDTLRLSREAIARGADALLVVTPNYFKPKMSGAALTHHYHTLAENLRRPVLIYSIPQFTGVHVSEETLVALSHHPNIVGLKESSGDLKFLRKVIRKSQSGFRVFVGSAQILLNGLRAGAAGAVLSQANFMPDLCVGIYEAFRTGSHATARTLQRSLEILAHKVTVPFGVPGIKAAMDCCGYAGGKPRSPLLPMTAEEQRLVVSAVREASLELKY